MELAHKLLHLIATVRSKTNRSKRSLTIRLYTKPLQLFAVVVVVFPYTRTHSFPQKEEKKSTCTHIQSPTENG